MYRIKRVGLSVILNLVALVCLFFVTINVVPYVKATKPYSLALMFLTSAALFCVLVGVSRYLDGLIAEKLLDNALYTGETSILSEFIDELRVCYSLDDFYQSIGKVLECKGDCSVLFVDREKNYIMYNSSDKLTNTNDVINTLAKNYTTDWKDGVYFMGDGYGILPNNKKARGIILVSGIHHFYVFCRYTKLFDPKIFPILLEEYNRFLSRSNTISQLSEIASLSKEWEQLAVTQRSFLPPEMPKIDKLKVAAYFRPLVNVSGDYYTVLPITPTKTLLMLGDVSGKGLAAALVMGLVINTVKNIENKEDLPAMVKKVDKAIKSMKLQDKYTVVFIGIVDTEKMTITYINASMSDPLIITRSPEGYRIKPLTSNCSLVGIIELDELQVTEQRLFRGDVILMASDGVSEVMNDEGVELGDTQLYQDTIKASASKTPQEFIDDVVNLVLTYNGGKKLRDDLTMMVAKVD